IVDCLAADLLDLLTECLTETRIDRDKLDVGMLLILSRRCYINGLLFRDYGEEQHAQYSSIGGERIHDQAITYVYQVLGRKLTLAQNLLDRATNMHLLFQNLCRSAKATGWEQTEVRRDREGRSRNEDRDGFGFVAGELKRQRADLGNDFSSISKRRRIEFGPLWLTVADASTQAPEEMSLFDVLTALLLPLHNNFAEVKEIRLRFLRVIESLNERYMLLRSCGLDPSDWAERAEPSINVLKEMKKLRDNAKRFLHLDALVKSTTSSADRQYVAGDVIGDMLSSGLAGKKYAVIRKLLNEDRSAWKLFAERTDEQQVYATLFDALKGEQKKFAGSTTFMELVGTEHGMTMFRNSLDELHDETSTDDMDETEFTVNIDQTESIRQLTIRYAEQFDPVMNYFFNQVLGEGRRLHVALVDPDFRHRIDDHPDYNGLSDGELAGQLYANAENIINQGLANTAREGTL
ncbi:MAG: hypothetical protein ACR2RB_05950, partial [Gammaproteobacteria bacterium]